MTQLPPPPATNLPPIEVTGHRRKERFEPFPEQPSPPYVPAYDSLDPVPEEPGPCDDAATREEFDSDAAAALALRLFEAWAARTGEPLQLREYFALLYRLPGGGVAVGPQIRGEPMTATVDPWGAEAWVGVDVANIVGWIHSHPGGGANPSPPDWAVYGEIYNRVVAAGGDATHLRPYISGTVDGATRLYVNKGGSYGKSDEGLEVNPLGRPCAG